MVRLSWRVSLAIAEFGVASLVALFLTRTSRAINVDPLVRVGQVSGLAQIQLRFALLALVILLLLWLAHRSMDGDLRDSVVRLVAAGSAGLVTGVIGSGLAVALRGTHFALFHDLGDTARIVTWVNEVSAGERMSNAYPPLSIYLTSLYGKLTGLNASYAYHDMQVYGAALFGPVAYMSWRLLFPPLWALPMALIPALPIIDPYKPYSPITLAVLMPVLGWFFVRLHRCAERSGSARAWQGALTGGLFGLLCLTYSGWFWWSAGGALVMVPIALPRRKLREAAEFLFCTGAGFLLVAGTSIRRMLQEGMLRDVDKCFYFDTSVRPSYFEMWRTGLSGNPGEWPPPAELGGTSVFLVLLATGLAAGIALSFCDSRLGLAAKSVVACLVSASLMRFKVAGAMFATQTVQLYPRTSTQILYCMLVMSVFAAFMIAQRLSARFPLAARELGMARVGALAGVLLVCASSADAIADKYMPSAASMNAPGILAWRAHAVKKENGQCSRYMDQAKCE